MPHDGESAVAGVVEAQIDVQFAGIDDGNIDGEFVEGVVVLDCVHTGIHYFTHCLFWWIIHVFRGCFRRDIVKACDGIIDDANIIRLWLHRMRYDQ